EIIGDRPSEIFQNNSPSVAPALTRAVKSAGFFSNVADPGHSPFPFGPWQVMQLLTKSFCPSAIVFAFTGTGFGRFAAVGGAFQSELCASSGPPIDKTASPISALEQRAAEFRDFIDLSNVELQKCV